MWRTVFGDPARPLTPFRRQVAVITGRREPRASVRAEALDTAAWVQRLTGSGHFVTVDSSEFRWSIELTTAQIRDLFTTFSDWSAVEVDEAARAVDGLGGTVVEHYVSPLVVLRRVDLPGDLLVPQRPVLLGRLGQVAVGGEDGVGAARDIELLSAEGEFARVGPGQEASGRRVGHEILDPPGSHSARTAVRAPRHAHTGRPGPGSRRGGSSGR